MTTSTAGRSGALDPLGDIVAQQAAVRTLQKALERDTLAQAYLFEGPDGVGKHKTALALASARLLAGAQPSHQAELLAKLAHGNHPDVRVFPPRTEGNRNLPVRIVRDEIQSYIQYAPFEAHASFLVFPQADISLPAQHPEAANALLKALEEPRANIHFVLTSARPQRLLPTIRSRCQRVRFGRLPDRVLAGILRERGVPAETLEAAIMLADGRADRAIELSQEGRSLELVELALELDAAISATEPSAQLDAAYGLAQHEQRSLALETLARFYREVARAGLGFGGRPEAPSKQWQAARARAEQVAPHEAASRVALIAQLGEDLDRNANALMALESMLMELRHAGRALARRRIDE
ncbi:MAG: AAA family ATPase [Proteobacteria bacterium]|nr:AAA family ATPase [Pseudomonadota bacterium]